MARTRSRNQEEKLERRDAILDAAMTAFFTRGFEKTSMDDIAKGAGLSRSLLYVYFRDKDDIHMGLCLRAAESILAYKQEEQAKHTLGIDKVQATGQAYYRFYRENPRYFTLLSMRLGKSTEISIAPEDHTETQLAMQVMEDKIMQMMVGAIVTGLEDGSISKDKVSDPLQTAMFLRGSLHGIILLQDAAGSQLFDRAGLEREPLIHYSITMITQSLAAESVK